MALSSFCLPRAYRAYRNRKLGGREMPRGRITKRSVDALQCPAGRDRDFLWDDALAGFGVAAFPTGRKVYVAQYRQNGRSRRANIGEHGRLTPDEARSQAKTILGAVEQARTLSPNGAPRARLRLLAKLPRTFSLCMSRQKGNLVPFRPMTFCCASMSSPRLVARASPTFGGRTWRDCTLE